MSLHAGLDTCAIISFGIFSKNYGQASPGAIANLYASLGYMEDAPNVAIKIINIVMHYYRRWRMD
jgi:hypothetical protein